MFLGSRKKRCRRVRGLLSEYIDGRLNADSVDFVNKHFGTCAGCSEEFETLRLTVGLFNRVPSVAAPRSFAIREIDVVEARPDRTRRPRALRGSGGCDRQPQWLRWLWLLCSRLISCRSFHRTGESSCSRQSSRHPLAFWHRLSPWKARQRWRTLSSGCPLRLP